jgi:acetyl-CoA carboxylase biotin carboxyl carrier protein
VDLKEIKSIIELMTKNGLTEFELEKDNVKIRIKRGSNGGGALVTAVSPENGGEVTQVLVPAPAPVPVAQLPAAAAPKPAVETNIKEIKAPMVGTFYRAPSPDSPPYVEVGKAVTEETVVCIVEAMKVMNEIKAEMKGVITEILIDNAKPVEFGKPLFRVKVS